ncbi:YheC/YheD family endospore coat-associated protein [Alkalihalobacterium elongatum]|uniref:YheC/YheD family endospore coat-associated protein n=1 Tax=Alkalihalobacterium elongatum TaxID=2675466 RepID=UPI001C1F4230|nr:YheC/YheD family protein [Alkalihalobacterium elongatum]
MKQTFQIQRRFDDQSIIQLPASYLKSNSLYPNTSIELAFGSKTAHCQLTENTECDHTVVVSDNVWRQLNLPFETSIHLFYHNRCLLIGPLIGIFTAGFTPSKKLPLGQRTSQYTKILRSQEEIGGFYFIFGHHLIDWENGEINGYFLIDGSWTLLTVPFPNVIYNRIPNRRTENLDMIQTAKKKFETEYAIPYFNPNFFNKQEIHEQLSKNDTVLSFLPESLIKPSSQQLKALLSKYKHLYLKPIEGSHGDEIKQLIKLPEEPYYYCRFHDEDQIRLRRYSNITRLLQHEYPNGLEDVIVQQGIDLLKLGKQPMDFRIHTNKNIDGQWEITAMAAKKAGWQSVTTHIHRGGEVISVDELVYDGLLSKKRVDELKQVSLTISRALDFQLEGCIGEIGFDLGIDRNGEIWLFEANSKPGRLIFEQGKLKREDIVSRELPLEYAIYLSKKAFEAPDQFIIQLISH